MSEIITKTDRRRANEVKIVRDMCNEVLALSHARELVYKLDSLGVLGQDNHANLIHDNIKAKKKEVGKVLQEKCRTFTFNEFEC